MNGFDCHPRRAQLHRHQRDHGIIPPTSRFPSTLWTFASTTNQGQVLQIHEALELDLVELLIVQAADILCPLPNANLDDAAVDQRHECGVAHGRPLVLKTRRN